MKLKVVSVSEAASGIVKEVEEQQQPVTKKGREEELIKLLSGQSGVGKEGEDEETEQMGDVRVEPVPRFL